ncbi:hypothetical protein [Nostoc sp. ChiVER01]|uniref:hypothetical protein n=1 Tax=Nostoc sp. ChiVER01 TaxID=3075382 RepID=UPI002AD317D7|nr:hypothetical protein [Nostoc sp. ChiVER01]MDZ8222602.1 hypothetical protein [Nostoc sp. ChiVER01]
MNLTISQSSFSEGVGSHRICRANGLSFFQSSCGVYQGYPGTPPPNPLPALRGGTGIGERVWVGVLILGHLRDWWLANISCIIKSDRTLSTL